MIERVMRTRSPVHLATRHAIPLGRRDTPRACCAADGATWRSFNTLRIALDRMEVARIREEGPEADKCPEGQVIRTVEEQDQPNLQATYLSTC